MKKVFVICAASLILVFSAIIYSQYDTYLDYHAEELALSDELASENETLAKYEREKEQRMSDAYVEKIARERGFVRRDEIIFINEAAK